MYGWDGGTTIESLYIRRGWSETADRRVTVLSRLYATFDLLAENAGIDDVISNTIRFHGELKVVTDQGEKSSVTGPDEIRGGIQR